MKKIFFCLVLFFTFLITKAQTSIALTGGFQRASVTPPFVLYPDTLKKKSTTKIGILFGAVVIIPVKENFFIRTGILYSAKGSNSTQYYDTSNLYASTANLVGDKKFKKFSINTVLNIQYIDVPVNLMYKYKLGKGNLFFALGPQFSIFYNGSTSSNTVSVAQENPSSKEIKYDSKFSENKDLLIGKQSERYRVVHVGMNALAGIESNKIFLNLHYSRDLSEFYEEGGRNYKHQTIGAAIGVYLSRK